MHLHLSVRPSLLPDEALPYVIEGSPSSGIERHHPDAEKAVASIGEFCGTHQCTATVRVYTPRDRLWREDEIDAEGAVRISTPVWRLSKGEGLRAATGFRV